MENNNKIKSGLVNLPINPVDKAMVWLVYSGLKPAANISVKPTDLNLEERTYCTSQKNYNKITNYLDKLGLFYKLFIYYSPGWKRIKYEGKIIAVSITKITKTLYIGKTKEIAEKIYHNRVKINLDAYARVYEAGISYGFPEKAVVEYARAAKESREWISKRYKVKKINSKIKFRENDPLFKNIMTAEEFDGLYKDNYWFPYVQFMVRRDNVAEDVKIAISWADKIKEDHPLLDKQLQKIYRNVKIGPPKRPLIIY